MIPIVHLINNLNYPSSFEKLVLNSGKRSVAAKNNNKSERANQID